MDAQSESRGQGLGLELDRLFLFNQHIPPSKMNGENVVQFYRAGRCFGLTDDRQAIRGMAGCGQHVPDTVREALAGVRNAASHRKRAEVVQRIRDFFVDRPLTVLELALNRKRLLTVLANAEDVDAPVLSDDRLADLDLPVHL